MDGSAESYMSSVCAKAYRVGRLCQLRLLSLIKQLSYVIKVLSSLMSSD